VKNILRQIVILLLVSGFVFSVNSQTGKSPSKKEFTIDNCVNTLDKEKTVPTKVGYQYWFAGKDFIDGRTLKLSVVAPRSATHPPHSHPEDEFFFILEGEAEFFLAGQTKNVGPMTSLYCPPDVEHGIKNIGDTELKYLVIKKYPVE